MAYLHLRQAAFSIQGGAYGHVLTTQPIETQDELVCGSYCLRVSFSEPVEYSTERFCLALTLADKTARILQLCPVQRSDIVKKMSQKSCRSISTKPSWFRRSGTENFWLLLVRPAAGKPHNFHSTYTKQVRFDFTVCNLGIISILNAL